MSTLNVAHQQLKPEGKALEAQIDPKETRKRRGRDQYTRVVSFCSNMAMLMISVK